MIKILSILFVGVLVCLSLPLEVKSWKSFERQLFGNSNPINGLFQPSSKFNLDINSLFREKFNIFRSDDGWYFNNKDTCTMNCRFLACVFQKRPSEQELCQQSFRNKNFEHSCCEKYGQPGGGTTERPIFIELPQSTTPQPTDSFQFREYPPSPPQRRRDQGEKRIRTAFIPAK